MHYIMYIKRECVRESERATARARAEVRAREPERQGGRADLRGIGRKGRHDERDKKGGNARRLAEVANRIHLHISEVSATH